jgi:hypothetical protein
MILVHVDPEKMAGMTEADFKALDAQNYASDQKLFASGHLIASGPLAAPETATLVRSVDGKVSMTDGPYVETKEHLGGFMLIEARDREEALAIAARDSMARYGTLEVREQWALKAQEESGR